MADDWIKMRTDLYRDPKVSLIAEHLMDDDSDLSRYVNQMKQRDMTVTRNVTVGALVSIWGVMRHRGKRVDDDLVCYSVAVHILDDIADLPGIGEAMSLAGWVIQSEEGIVFPNFFDEYNNDPAERAKEKTRERQRKFREKKANEQGLKSNVTHNVTVTHREEKRRDKENIQKKTSVPHDFAISDRVKKWAEKNHHGNLEQHLENFILTCESKDYKYVNLDSAFMRAVRDNWAKINNHKAEPYNPGKLLGMEEI